jgi:hypothetical protein
MQDRFAAALGDAIGGVLEHRRHLLEAARVGQLDVVHDQRVDGEPVVEPRSTFAVRVVAVVGHCFLLG